MNKGLCVLTFILGAAGGSFVTYKLLKRKYEEIAQEEIDSVKEMYRNHQETVELEEKDQFIVTEKEAEKLAKQAIEKPNISEYKKMIKTVEYIGEKEDSSNEVDNTYRQENMSDPYVIAPEEYGEDYDYDKINLTYYADGVLADENDEEVENVDGTVGLDSLETFGTYEDDSVHVKNDRLRAYYEILRDERNYEDIIAGRPNSTDFNEYK